MTFVKKAFFISSAFALSTFITSCSPSGNRKVRLSGAGATFPAKIYTRWFADLAKEGGPRVNYQSVGSGAGRKAFIDQTVNFGLLTIQ